MLCGCSAPVNLLFVLAASQGLRLCHPTDFAFSIHPTSDRQHNEHDGAPSYGDFVYSSFWCIAKVPYIYDTIDTHPLHSGEFKNVFTFGLFLTASTNFTNLG